MKRTVIGTLLASAVLTGCNAQVPNDSGATSTSMPIPNNSSSDFQFEPSATAVAMSKEIIGMSEAQAIQTIEGVSSEQLTARVIRRDLERYVVTMDYSVSRINLEIDNGIVTKSSIG